MKMRVAEMVYAYPINMSSRPEFYSGRGAITTDLNYTKLQAFYDAIVAEIGQDAATAFVRMVADMESLSATAFLNRLYELEACDWHFAPRESRPAEGHDVGPDGPGRYVTGIFSVAGALYGGDRDKTEWIRRDFLDRHQEELPKAERRKKQHAYDIFGNTSCYK